MAIGDSRILGFDGRTVRIRCRKPTRPGREKPKYGTAEMSAETFIDRFLLHVLPSGIQRIRHFGILANNCRAASLRQARDDLGIAEPSLLQRPAKAEADDGMDADAGPIPCPPLRRRPQGPRRAPGRDASRPPVAGPAGEPAAAPPKPEAPS